MTDAEWYVGLNGAPDGPHSPLDMEGMVLVGQAGPETLVWRDGLPGWVRVSSTTEFAHLFRKMPPPLPRTLPPESRLVGEPEPLGLAAAQLLDDEDQYPVPEARQNSALETSLRRTRIIFGAIALALVTAVSIKGALSAVIIAAPFVVYRWLRGAQGFSGVRDPLALGAGQAVYFLVAGFFVMTALNETLIGGVTLGLGLLQAALVIWNLSALSRVSMGWFIGFQFLAAIIPALALMTDGPIMGQFTSTLHLFLHAVQAWGGFVGLRLLGDGNYVVSEQTSRRS